MQQPPTVPARKWQQLPAKEAKARGAARAEGGATARAEIPTSHHPPPAGPYRTQLAGHHIDAATQASIADHMETQRKADQAAQDAEQEAAEEADKAADKEEKFQESVALLLEARDVHGQVAAYAQSSELVGIANMVTGLNTQYTKTCQETQLVQGKMEATNESNRKRKATQTVNRRGDTKSQCTYEYEAVDNGSSGFTPAFQCKGVCRITHRMHLRNLAEPDKFGLPSKCPKHVAQLKAQREANLKAQREAL
jgi:hypothetical protein